MNNVKNKKGFSMVEVLVVMSIIMVLSAVAGLSISVVNNANVSKAVEVAKNLHTACEEFMKEFNNSADALINSKSED